MGAKPDSPEVAAPGNICGMLEETFVEVAAVFRPRSRQNPQETKR